jgi:glycosyltransferase involved in cell wall biosynthesis
MLVGIEASAALVSRRTGVGNYIANMIGGLQRLSEARADVDFVYFSNRNGSLPNGNGDATRTVSIYPNGHLPSRMLWMQLSLRRGIARTQPDLCHFPNYLAPLCMGAQSPFLVTMYDMSVYRCAQYQPMKTVAVHRAMIPILARRASLIVTISESARQDILHYLRVPEERVRVIYGGIGQQFQTQTLPDQADTAQVRGRYGLERPYILTVGTLEPRKNHARLIEAFSWLVQQERLPHHLVIAGTHGWKEHQLHERVKRSKVADRIHFLGYVPAADLPGLYRGADVFAFPSLYEGFGLPLLEAFGCGVPSLISSNPALTEVAGEGAAVVVEPHSVQDIAGGLQRLLADADLAASLRARGLARAREFSWDRCAAETFQLYQQVLVSKPHTTPLYCTR